MPIMPERRRAARICTRWSSTNTAPAPDAVHGARSTTSRAATGISAEERARTIRAIIDPATRPADLVRPGHLFPLVAKEGGVLRRAGHTEATVDLARLAGLTPAGVLCEILDGIGMASRERLHAIAARVRPADPLDRDA